MSSELGSCLMQLKICLDTQQVPRARNLIARISQLIVETTSESEAETEFHLECIFEAPNGLVAFLQRSFRSAKQLAKANEDVFELFRKTIEKHSSLLRKWVPPVVALALRYIQSSSVTARERELATLVLQDSIAYGCLRKDSYERLDQLLDELLAVFQQCKLPNRFQQNLFELLGQLARHFPECVTEPGRLRDVFLSEAESQLLEENYPSLVSLAGAMRGLDLFLFNFAPAEGEQELRKRLYLLVKKLSIWDEGRSEKAAFRNALQVLADHAPLFTVYLYEDHVHWQSMLVGKWIKSANRDDRQVALAALYAFHGEVARVLSRPEIATESERQCPPTVDVLNQYLAYYRKLLNGAGSDRSETRMAIRGFGIMAGPCRRVTGSTATLNELLTIVLDRIEGICGRPSAGDMLEYLPDFMQALSEILTHVRELSTVQLVSVQTMIVALMRDFYHLSTAHHDLIVRSLLCTLENIGKLGGSALEQLLDNVLLQGVIWSCTHSLPYGPPVAAGTTGGSDAPHPYDWKRELVTYRNYLPLWRGLLGKSASPGSDDTLTRAIYRAFQRTLFVIVGKLDLSTRKRTFHDEDGQQRELFFCDPNLDRVPNKPQDYHIFLNLVELYREVLHGPQTPPAVRELFAEWTRRYFEQFVKRSLRHPLVSGFVKLIEMGLGTAEQIGYFTQPAQDDRDSRATAMLLVFYLESTIRTALQATGELQLACLRFVLHAPARLLMDFIEHQQDHEQPLLVAVFRAAFRLGRGLLSIARTALACLQRIVLSRDPPLHAEQREQLLRRVLPLLEPYLGTRDSTQPAASAASVRLARFKRHRTANVAAGKIERIKEQHRNEQATEMSELVAFQLRVLHFLGDLQPNECRWMVPDDAGGEPDGPDSPSLTRWDADSERSIELRLLCASGTRPCIKLDSVIGRVCELAVESGDRATKLAACELLHTIVLYLLGIHYQDQLHGLWSQLCRHLLQLSCDPDLAVCQMFEPLLFQIVHYLTQPAKLSQRGTGTLLDSLMDATANARNSAVRDLAVRCLREFLQWTNRQSGTSRSYDDRMRVKRTLLELLKTYALESDAGRRYGAALAFNNLFRLLAQDDPHLVRYWFELTHAFALGFIVTEEHHCREGAGLEAAGLGQFELALEHAGKVLEQRRALFNGDRNDGGAIGELRQIVPPGIGGGELKHLVRWLFRQCAARQRRYRRKCMQLYPRLAAAVRDVAGGAEFLRNHFTPDEVEAVCVQASVPQGIGQAPTLDRLRDTTQEHHSLIAAIFLWLEYLLASLDITCWLLRESLLPSEASLALLARVLPPVRYFLQSLATASMSGLMVLANPDPQPVDTLASSSELRMNADKLVRFDALKAALVVQIVDLLVLLLEPDAAGQLILVSRELLDDPATVAFILSLLFESHQLGGLDGATGPGTALEHDSDTDARLWQQLDTVVLRLTERRSPPSSTSFAHALSAKLVSTMEALGVRMRALLVQRTVGEIDQKLAKGLLFVVKHRQARPSVDCAVIAPDFEYRLQTAARKLLDDCYEAIGQEGVRMVPSPSAARFGTLVLRATLGLAAGGPTDKRLLERTVACSLDGRPLQPNIGHGQHFVACFGPAVFGLFVAEPGACMDTLLGALSVDNFPAIVRFLCDLLEHLYRAKAPDGEQRLRRLVEILLRSWDRLFGACARSEQANRFGACDLQLIELMSNVAMVCPFPLHEIRTHAGPAYERWLVGLIGTASAPIALKSKAILLLPSLLGAGEPDAPVLSNAPLEDALERLQAAHFPLRSTEFPPNSAQRVGFVNCLERLLDALVVSRSPLLLQAIIQMTAPDGEGNVAEDAIRSAIERFFTDQSSALQCTRLQQIWELFANHGYAPTVRGTILRRYLCTGLWRCSYDTVTAFYARNITTISELANVELYGRAGWELEHALVDRTAAFRLVEQYAALLPKSLLLADDCPVAGRLYGNATAPVRGQRLVADFSKRAHGARVVPFRGDDRTATELFRRYQCAAYRALVALISNTNDNARMYSVLLFRENRDKGEFLWRRLVDCSDDDLYLEAGQEQQEAPRIVQKRVAIRREEEGGGGGEHESPGHSFVVAESSLSQQVSRFDLNHSAVLSAREVALREAGELSRRQRGTRASVPLERTAINEHEVMATVCGCVRHMVRGGISTEPLVRFIVDSLLDAGQPKNVRLFLAKVIDNCRVELATHAALLLAPLMQLVVDERIFRGLNTLVTDLVALVLEWSPRGPEGMDGTAATLASSLLRFLVKYSCQPTGGGGGGGGSRGHVFRLNLELIRTLVQRWHAVLTVPTELLFVMVTARATGGHSSQQGSDGDEQRSQFELIAGLQLGSVVLTHGGGRLVPWLESNRDDYLAAIVRCWDAPSSAVHKPAAHLLGLALARLYPAGVPDDQPAEGEGPEGELLAGCITKLSNMHRAQGRKFIEVLYEVAKAFPSIVDPFLTIVSFRIPTAAPAEKRMGLELLLGGRLERFRDELYRELASLDLPQLLRDGELQLATLHLLNRALPLVGELQDLQQLIEPVGAVATRRATPPACRAVAYEILIYIDEKRARELSDERRQAVWRYLIRGLCDDEEDDGDETGTTEVTSRCRARVLEYLTDTGKLPGDVSERFLYLLGELYDPAVEAGFLGAAVALLLDPAVRCRESKDRLFLHEYLSADVKFREYTIETGARARHSLTVLTPLFAGDASHTQRGHLQASLVTGRGSQMEQLIRATQFASGTVEGGEGREFEPTQDPTRFTRAGDTFALPTQHSLLFEASSLRLDRRSQRTGGSVPEGPDTTTEERTFERLRRRILRDSDTNRQRQTAWAVGRHYSTQRKRTEERRTGASKVALYRRYRLADYPDLQINLLAFLLPLQALCRRDGACARSTFVALFNGLVDSFGTAAGEPGWAPFLARLDRSLQHILESSRVCDPHLFGALMELGLAGRTSGRLTLSPRTVASVAGASNMLPMGVLYVEGKLTDGDEFDDEPVRSQQGDRDRGSEADHWLQLSALYHTLREHDAVAGIFGDKLDSDPRLRDAIELEALGWYERAHRAYYELIASVSPARGEERNFCYKSAYGCLMRLGQWDVLLDEIGGQVATDHGELWTDDWNRENLLPSYMRGNVRLNLAGDSGGREFCRILDEWMQVPARADHIRQLFGEELTALQLASGELVRARLYAEQTQRQFLDEWHCAGVLSAPFRLECLLAVRQVLELGAYAELLEGRDGGAEDSTERLAAAWRNAVPRVTDSLIGWDTIVAYRRFLLGKLQMRAPGAGTRQLSGLLFELELDLLGVAFEQGNVQYAGKMIARLRTDEATGGEAEPSPEQHLRRRIARLRYDRVRQLRTGGDSTQLLKGFRRLAQLTAHTLQLEPQQAPLARAKGAAWTELFHYSECFRARAESLVDREEGTGVLSIIQSTTMLVGDDDDAPVMGGGSLGEALHQFSLHCLQRTVEEVSNGRANPLDSASQESEYGTTARELADAHFRMAQYCYEQLDPARSEQAEAEAERRLVTALLPAIRYGSREARQLFPVLLQLRNLHNNTLRREFDALCRTVPSWNFLPWIPQLLSHLRSVEQGAAGETGSFLDELLLRLAREYPMALYFPARVTLEQGPDGGPERPFISRFRATLRHPVVDRFVEELCRVVMPELRLLALVSELGRTLASFTNRAAYRSFVERGIAEWFTRDATDARYGKAYRALCPQVEHWLALKDLHPVEERAAIEGALRALDGALRSLRPRGQQSRVQLDDLSPWLADYHYGGQRDEAIELPGQYDAAVGVDGPPNTASGALVRLVKIVPDLVVYGTLRLPVQITFRGSDGRQYRFLAKYGEDLRQDQRIQQLQREITHRLRQDRRCTEQRLELRTYPVVPIRPDFGMLGWLEGTVSLQDIAKLAGPRYNPATDRGQGYVREQYGRFLLSVSRQTPTSPAETLAPSLLTAPALYGAAACHCPPARLRLKYLELAQSMRPDTLRRALFDMASSPEAFYRLRMNFGRSLAALNITGWVLGIGDRHLSNIVLERATGKLVGVDFGMAFGAGTRDLPVPELVPFRLTPQFVGVMEPMRLSGVLHKCHLYTLQCLRDARRELRACLEVFIREPTVDWLEAARHRSGTEGTKATTTTTATTTTASGREWNPGTRVDTVMRKLDGANPKRLLVEELRLGVIAQQREFLVGYLALVNAAAEQSSKLAADGAGAGAGAGQRLSTELQVGMLLELATDEKLLGIAYSGWYPWF